MCDANANTNARIYTCEPGQLKRKRKCKRKAKIQVPSVPCHHGTVQKKMAPTSSAISEEKLLGSDRKFPVFLDKSLPNLKKKPRRPLLGKMWPDKLAVKDGIFYRRL